MLHIIPGTVFNSGAQTLVNAVNTVGVMGAGLALEFQLRFPSLLPQYQSACRSGELSVSTPVLHQLPGCDTRVLSFATKQHWRDGSDLRFIESGLQYFVANYKSLGITSIAFPKLGAGLGGLSWDQVLPLMIQYLEPLQDIDIFICLDELDHAEGSELMMLRVLAHLVQTQQDLSAICGISQQGAASISSIGVPKRFRQLQKYPGIGKDGYKALFTSILAIASEYL